MSNSISLDMEYIIPISFQTVVCVVAFVIWIMFFRNYRKKLNELSKRLLITMSLYIFSMIFSTFVQINRHIFLATIIEAPTLEIIGFFYIPLFLLANYTYYQFFLTLFEKTEDETRFQRSYLILTILGFILFLILLLFQTENVSLISEVYLLLHSFILHVRMAHISFHLFKRIEDEGRYGFLSLGIMSMFLILALVSMIMNTVWDTLTGQNYGPFNYVLWVMLFAAVFSAYIGFTFPEKFRNWVKNLNKKNN